MFETVELGHKLAKAKFEAELPRLRTELLDAHRELQGRKFQAIFIIGGNAEMRKGQVVKRLNEWLEPHGVQTQAFWRLPQDKNHHPEYLRFWRAMPGHGKIGIFFGSWYADPVLRRACGEVKRKVFEHDLDRIAIFEKMLTDDGALIVKVWLHLSRKEQRKELKQMGKQGRVAPSDRRFYKLYDEILEASEQAISHTDSASAPWHLVEAADSHYCEYTVGTILLEALRARLSKEKTAAQTKAKPADALIEERKKETVVPTGNVLDEVDLSQKLSDADYRKSLDSLQGQLGKLAWAAHDKKISTVLAFEGWDAAGKGSSIRRVIWSIDPRLYRVAGIAAPSDEERAQHYLWRFWRRLPDPGFVTVFDRSWYGRVLVERVEGFASEPEWSRAYLEINQFEEQLVESGMVLNKFWLHISPEEQLRRFKERERIAYKRYKITDEDWRNRKKWDQYKVAVNDMLTRCNPSSAPWTVVAGNDKKFARIQILKAVVRSLERAL